MEELENRYSRFIIQMPTGSGKTRTACEIVSHYMNAKQNSSVIWIAHSKELCDQAAECFKEVWPHLAYRDISIGRHYGRSKIDFSQIGSKLDFLCTTFQSLHALKKKFKTFEMLNSCLHQDMLIIVDEAHKKL